VQAGEVWDRFEAATGTASANAAFMAVKLTNMPLLASKVDPNAPAAGAASGEQTPSYSGTTIQAHYKGYDAPACMTAIMHVSIPATGCNHATMLQPSLSTVNVDIFVCMTPPRVQH